MTSTTPPPLDQRYLVGPTLYLRLIELADAPTAAIWRKEPFPVPAEVVEEKLRERFETDPGAMEEQQLFLICRRADDEPVGSVEVDIADWRSGLVRFSPDPLAPSSVQDAIIAEVIGFLGPFLLQERNLMMVVIRMTDRWPDATAEILALGGREQFRHRQRLLSDGRRMDVVIYQLFNPIWVEKLGMPEPPIFGPVERHVQSPAAMPVLVHGEERPPSAVVVGERLYLRAVRPEEGHLVSRWTREETETYYPSGRFQINAHTFGDFHRKLAAEDYPSWIRFAIVVRETDEMIGCNGLDNISWLHRSAETETEIFRPVHRGAGFGTEAKHLLLEYAFERLGFHMVFSYVSETNPRSVQALRKQGYREAGAIAWDSFCATGLCQDFSFDLLAEEWRAARDMARR